MKRLSILLATVLALTVLSPGPTAFAGTTTSAPAPRADGDTPGLVPVTPARLLDTRTGGAMVKTGGTVKVQAAGRGGLPGSGVAAVVVNLTVTRPTAPGYLTAYPTGAQRPEASTVNYAKTQTVANQAIVKVDASGSFTLYASAATHALVDVTGYFPTGAGYTPLSPARVLDTRSGTGAPKAIVKAGGTVRLKVTGAGGVPAAGAGAVVLNITDTAATGPGFVTAYPEGVTRPNASTLNYAKAQTAAGMTIAKIGDGGYVDLYTSASSHLVADVAGWFPTTSDYTPLTPTRVLDTRATGTGQLRAGKTLDLQIAGTNGVPATGTPGAPTAVEITVTATAPKAAGFVTTYPTGVTRPTVSTVNYDTNQTIANSATTGLGTDGKITLYTPADTHLVVDVVGYYAARSAPAAVVLSRDATTTPGTLVTPALAPDLTSIETLTTTLDAPLSASVDASGQLAIAAGATTATGKRALEITGTGCDTAGCGRSFHLTLTLEVTALASTAPLTGDVTQPSPDRIDTPVFLDGDVPALADEILLVLNPGTSSSRARAIATDHGGTVSAAFTDIGVYELRWSTRQNISALLAQVEDEPDVQSATGSVLTPLGTTDAGAPSEWNDPVQSSYGWGLRMIHAPDAWRTTTGDPAIAVGIVDTGTALPSHRELDVTTRPSPPRATAAAADHATGVAGLACARSDGSGVVGVSWGCPLVSSGLAAVREHNADDPFAYNVYIWKNVLAAAEDVIADPRVRVVNMSLGINNDGCASQRDLESIRRVRGITAPIFAPLFSQGHGRDVVWTLAAGNNCSPQPASPMGWWAQDANVVTVASVNADGTLSSFSNYGDDVEVAAPGGVGPDDTNGPRVATADGRYGYEMGTSQAAPLVAGIAQLAFSANPAATSIDVGRCLTITADTPVSVRSDLPRAYDPKLGYQPGVGIVDAAAAVACARGRSAVRTTVVPNGQVGTPYSTRLAATDDRPGAWTVESGSLPRGLQLSGDTIAGTPSAPGTSTFTVKFDDGFVPATKQLTMDVTEATGRPHSMRISSTADGAPGSDDSRYSAISGDGRFITYASDAADLVTNDTNGRPDIFLFDRTTGTTTRINVAADGSQADGNSYEPKISGDGRYITYTSAATNLVAGSSGTGALLFDRTTGTTTRIDVAADGSQANGGASSSVISADGRYLAYLSGASNLVRGDTNGRPDIFLLDRTTGTTTRINVAADGSQADGNSYEPKISGDGRYITYDSYANNLVPADSNSTVDTFLFDGATGQTIRVNRAADGSQADGDSYEPAISDDGRFITYESEASNLVPNDTNRRADIFVFDRTTGQNTRISTTNGAEGNGSSGGPVISGDGRFIAYASGATNLVTEDTDSRSDIYLFDRTTGETSLVSPSTDTAAGRAYSSDAALSGDGRYVTYTSGTSSPYQIFSFDRSTA